MHPVEISAGLLHLRPWSMAELDELVAARSDPEIMRWGDDAVPRERHEFVERIETGWPAGWESGTALSWAVLDSVTTQLVASVSLHAVDDVDRVWELGMWTAPWARRRGVGRTAVAAVCRFAFGALDAQRIEWTASAGNVASQELALAVGFTHEGTLRSRLAVQGDPSVREDAWLGSLLPGETLS